MKNNWKDEMKSTFKVINDKSGFLLWNIKKQEIASYNDLQNYVESLLAEQNKAYGGCDKCYGKGYATNIDFMSGKGIHYQAPYYLPCDCNRGEQIRRMIAEQKKYSYEEGFNEGKKLVCNGKCSFYNGNLIGYDSGCYVHNLSLKHHE